MKKKLLSTMSILSVGLITIGLLAGCGSKTAEAGATNGTITMGTNAEFEPFEYRENGTDITGFDVEIAKEIAKKLGKELVIEDMDFNTLLLALSSDKVDFVAAGLTVDEDRKTQVDFSDTYFKSKQMIIVGADNTDINTAEDLAGKKVGVQLGTTGDLYASMDDTIGSVIQFKSGTLAVMDLKNGQVDAVIIDAEPAKKMTEGQSDLKLLDAPFVEEEYAIAVKKGDTELAKAINDTLAELKSNGKYDELYKKYFDDGDK